MVEASGLGLVGLTGYQALFYTAKLEPGRTVFTNGGSTSVGAYVIQIAKSLGCRVIAIASGKNKDYVRQLGADEVTFVTSHFLTFGSSRPSSSPITQQHHCTNS